MSSLAADSLRARVRELGGVISPERARATSELYADLHGPVEDVQVTRDVAYGGDERHRLDVFVGPEADSGCPVVAFVHGGNFVAGDKRIGDGPFHDNVGVWAARAGYVGVTLTYRLAPGAPWPAGRDDVTAALAFVGEHAQPWGGDPLCVVAVGASAGATHVAGAAGLLGRERVAGVALLSGMYDLPAFGVAEVLTPYLGRDPEAWARASVIGGLLTSGVPALLAVAEHDPPAQHRQTALLAEDFLRRDGHLPHLAYLPGHNHFSEVLHIGTGDHLLTDQLDAFIAARRERSGGPSR